MSSENLDEPSDANLDSSSQDAAEASPSGDEVPSSRSAINVEGRVVVRVGAAIMVLSSLLGWVKVGGDSFPHVTGIGGTTLGTGLAVFVLGLSLLLRDWSIGVTLGKALGSFSVTVVFLSLVGPEFGTTRRWTMGRIGGHRSCSGGGSSGGCRICRPHKARVFQPFAGGAWRGLGYLRFVLA